MRVFDDFKTQRSSRAEVFTGMSEPDEGGFKVSDRRKFNPDGTPREVTPDEGVAPAGGSGQPAGEPVREKKADASRDTASSAGHEQAYKQAGGGKTPVMPPASFLGLLNMLGVEAAMHLGLMSNPAAGPPKVDLESARHLIDLLGIIQEKTRGNLTSEEDALLDDLLADLHMQYVAVASRT
jgi:hypothetical protein